MKCLIMGIECLPIDFHGCCTSGGVLSWFSIFTMVIKYSAVCEHMNGLIVMEMFMVAETLVNNLGYLGNFAGIA